MRNFLPISPVDRYGRFNRNIREFLRGKWRYIPDEGILLKKNIITRSLIIWLREIIWKAVIARLV